MKQLMLIALLAVSLTGCGAPYQSYHNGLVATQNNFHRQQLILDEQNQVTINDYKSKQKQQLVEQAKAQAEIDKQEGIGEGAKILAIAEAQAKANQLLAHSLSPLLVQQQLVNSMNDKTVIYVPSNVLPLTNIAAEAAAASR